MNKKIRLVGGPNDSEMYTVGTPQEYFYTATTERYDFTTLASAYPQAQLSIFKSTYRVRRIPSTLHPVHNAQQEIVYDFVSVEVR